MDVPPVDTLRTAFAQSIIATLATQVAAYMRLTAHPESRYSDLLDALDRGPVIGDDAARRLHVCTGISGSQTSPIIRRAFWEQVFRERGIDPAQLFRASPVSVAGPTDLSQPITQGK